MEVGVVEDVVEVELVEGEADGVSKGVNPSKPHFSSMAPPSTAQYL